MDPESQRRFARNEALFREANEAIERGLWPGEEDRTVRFRCECSRIDCNRAVGLGVREYERVRAHPRLFIVVDGHEVPDVEAVVEQHPGYLVVEKLGEGARVAEDSDPREGRAT